MPFLLLTRTVFFATTRGRLSFKARTKYIHVCWGFFALPEQRSHVSQIISDTYSKLTYICCCLITGIVIPMAHHQETFMDVISPLCLPEGDENSVYISDRAARGRRPHIAGIRPEAACSDNSRRDWARAGWIPMLFSDLYTSDIYVWYTVGTAKVSGIHQRNN